MPKPKETQKVIDRGSFVDLNVQELSEIVSQPAATHDGEGNWSWQWDCGDVGNYRVKWHIGSPFTNQFTFSTSSYLTPKYNTNPFGYNESSPTMINSCGCYLLPRERICLSVDPHKKMINGR